MSVFESILADGKSNERPAIPAGAMNHLDTMSKDRCFVGSVVFANQIIPTIWIKLSPQKARKIKVLGEDVFYPNYKLNTVEDRKNNLATVISMKRDGLPSLIVPLDTGNRAVHDFLELIRTTECFCLDVSVDSSKNPYGSTAFLEVDGEHLEWVGRNLIRSRMVIKGNNWEAAFKAFSNSQYAEAGAEALLFDQPDARVVDARRAEEFITRGDDAYEPDLSVVEIGETAYRYGWLREAHGLHVVNQSELLIRDKALIPFLSELEVDSLDSRRAAKELERLRRRFPGESFVLSRLLLLYRHLGNKKGEQSVLREMTANEDADLFTRLLLLSTLPTEVRNEEWRRNFPRPEAHHYTKGKRAVTVEEFFLFEEFAILELADAGKITAATTRLDRLVSFGCLEEMSRSIADMIVREVITKEIEKSRQLPRFNRNKKWPGVTEKAASILTEAYQDHISFLISELEKQGVVPPPPPPPRSVSAKPRRNEPCPCGSGNKYKYCCGK
jgi:hypothetical protein